jgi:hypothetical protein
MNEAQPEACDDAPSLSSADLFRLQAATFLSVAQALSQAGVISLPDLAGVLETHVGEHDREPWADIVRAYAGALRRDGAPEVEPSRPVRRFTVINGGRAN